jgi:hypothetical protein
MEGVVRSMVSGDARAERAIRWTDEGAPHGGEVRERGTHQEAGPVTVAADADADRDVSDRVHAHRPARDVVPQCLSEELVPSADASHVGAVSSWRGVLRPVPR